jgi:hypothetical protein
MPMLNITANMPASHFTTQSYRVHPSNSSAKSVSRAGTVVYLSPAALELAQQLEAIDAERKKQQQGQQQAQEEAPSEAELEANALAYEALAAEAQG